MNIYEQVKDAVSVRDAAYFYGLKPNRSGMVCCPFHSDQHPSMKVDSRKGGGFYCFGCGASGDVISFTGQLFSLSPYEAARKLAGDFGISPTVSGRPPIQKSCPTEASADTSLQERTLSEVYRNAWRSMLVTDPDSPDSFTQEYADAFNAVQISEYHLDCIERQNARRQKEQKEVRYER